jgi:hypothetical protein
MQLLVPQAVFGQGADLEVLYEDVAFGDQLQGDLLALGLGDIQRDRLLVAVHTNEVGAFLGAGHCRGGEAAGVVAGARAFDLDHVGAQIGEHLRAGWPRQNAGQVEYAKALQRPGGFGHLGLLDAGCSDRPFVDNGL